MKFKAAVLTESRKPLSVSDIEISKPLEPGQVLVKIHYSGICGTQIHEIDAFKGPDQYLPHLLGHEGSGIVVETGPGVKTVRCDDNVVLHWRPSTGIESLPPKYRWGAKTVNAGFVTTFNEYAIVSENRLTAIPKDFDKKIAPLFGCAVTTAMGVINNNAQVKIGESVVIFGLGGLGLNIAQAAAMVSAYPIIGIDLFDHKLDMAKEYGLTHAFNASKTKNLTQEIQKIIGESGADHVIETTGNGRVIEQAYNLTHPDGKTILVGVPKKDDNISIYSLPLHFKKTLTGSHGGESNPHEDIPRFVRLVNANKLKLNNLITHEYTLDNINEAIALVRSGDAGRVVVNMEHA